MNTPGSVRSGEFLERLTHYQLLEKDPHYMKLTHVETTHLPLSKKGTKKTTRRAVTINRELQRIAEAVCGSVVPCNHEMKLDTMSITTV